MAANPASVCVFVVCSHTLTRLKSALMPINGGSADGGGAAAADVDVISFTAAV